MNSKRNSRERENGRYIFFCKLNASGYLNSLPLVSQSLIEWEVRREVGFYVNPKTMAGRDINTRDTPRGTREIKIAKSGN